MRQFTGTIQNSVVLSTHKNCIAQEKVKSFKETVSFHLASNQATFLSQMHFYIFYIPALPAGH